MFMLNWEISKNFTSENLTKRLNEIKWTPDVRKPSTAKKNSRKSMRFTKIFLLMSKFLKPFLQHIKLELWTKYKFNFHSSKIPIKLIFRRILIRINYLHLCIFIWTSVKNTILLNYYFTKLLKYYFAKCSFRFWVIISYYFLPTLNSKRRNKHSFSPAQKRPQNYFRAKSKNRVQLHRTRLLDHIWGEDSYMKKSRRLINIFFFGFVVLVKLWKILKPFLEIFKINQIFLIVVC